MEYVIDAVKTALSCIGWKKFGFAGVAMTIEQRAEMIGKLADLYGDKNFNGQRCVMYAKFLNDLNDAEFTEAFYQVGKKFKFMPAPIDFIGCVRKDLSEDDEARLITGKIIESVGKYGFYQYKNAKEYIGVKGIKALELYGGWNSLCETLTCDNKGVIYSQLLGLVKSVLLASDRYFKEDKIALPDSELLRLFHGEK